MQDWLKAYMPEIHPELDRAIYSGVLRVLRLWMVAIPSFTMVTVVFYLFDDVPRDFFHGLLLFLILTFVFNIVDYAILIRCKPGQTWARIIQAGGLAYPILCPIFLVWITMETQPEVLKSFLVGTIPILHIILVSTTVFGFSLWFGMLAGLISTLLYLAICFGPGAYAAPALPTIIENCVYILIAGSVAGKAGDEARKLVHRVVASIKDREFVTRILGAYVSEEIKDRLLDQGLSMEGEEKEVTVLFSDLRDFTTLSEDMPPRRVVQILNMYFDRMVRIIQDEGGVVDKFIGDAIMAYFGAPVPLEHPRRNALRAAKRMRTELLLLNAQLKKNENIELNSGTGLHHGTVVLGSIGSEKRRDFTIIGDTVNIAARLESMTRKLNSPIIISEHVKNGLQPESLGELSPLEELTLKGRREPIVCYGVSEKESVPSSGS
ncbi:MAG: adenylate/guanylate cyclase domain-containing protein [Leptospiraceae bacterium]|nr:adenylate/guanylate cyclase domain-containing protein [Leptospiraceae bacterium]